MADRTIRARRPVTVVAIAAASFLCLSGAGSGVAAPAHHKHLWDNCTNYNNRYPHGVGKKHAHDHTTGTPVTDFKRSTHLYKIAMRHNPDLDRDKDHIACEKA